MILDKSLTFDALVSLCIKVRTILVPRQGWDSTHQPLTMVSDIPISAPWIIVISIIIAKELE